MLSIGEFSDRSGLSVKVLRTYGDMGLLSPAAVDAASGYRYYSLDQLHRAVLIATLRRAGVPLAEIAAFLAAPDIARFDQWADAMAAESNQRRRAFVEAKTLWNGEATMTLRHTIGTATHVGGRDSNQDTLLARERLVAVADGIGGLPGGEIASRTAIEILDARFGAEPTLSGLVAAVRAANRAIAEGGTTLTALAFTADAGMAFAHVGDSRLYRLRRGRLRQLTEDHTVVAELVAAGQVTDVEARTHEQRFVLTRAVGVAPDLEVDYGAVRATTGDRLLLCTDGLHRAVAVGDLAAVLEGDPQHAAEALVAAALTAETTDNVSVVVVAF